MITGPGLLSFGEMCEILSRVTGRSIPYQDIPDEALAQVLVQEAGMTSEQAEIGVICHFRAWREGHAQALTETVQELTGEPATSLEEWAERHRQVFVEARDRAPVPAA